MMNESSPHSTDERRFRAIIENIADGYYEVDAAGNLTFFNDAVCQILGYPREELLGMNFREYTDKENADRVHQTYNDVFNTGKPADVIGWKIIRKDGAKRDVEVSISLVRDARDEPIGFCGIVRDVTELEQAKSQRDASLQALGISEAKYQELVQHANSIILRLDSQGCVTFFNEFAQSFFGYAEHEILGQNVVGTIVPEGEKSGRDLTEMIQDIASHPERYISNENENVRHNGERVWMAWTNKAILDDEGHVTEVLCIGNDITERVRAEKALRKAHEELEGLVEERTAELAEANSKLEQEIAERAWAEEEQRKSKEFLENVINAIDDPVFVKDEHHRWVLLNDALCRVMGQPREGLIGKSDYDLTPKEQADLFWERDQLVLDTGKTDVSEEEATWRGELHTVSTKKSLYKDPVTAEKFIVGTIRDITDRVRAEKALAEEHNLSRTLIDNVPDFIFVKDTESRFVINNSAHLRVLGVTSQDEVLGKTDFDIFPHDLAAQYYADEQAVTQSGQPVINREEPYIDPVGDRRWLSTTKVPLRDSQGNILGLVGICRDITERVQVEEALKASEAKYRELVQSANSIIIRMDTLGRVTFFNEFAQRFFGYAEDEILGQNIVGTCVPERETTGRDLAAMIQDIVQHPERYATNENENMRRDGERVWVAWANKAIVDDEGYLAEILCVGNDITERVRTEEALRVSEERFALAVQGSNDGIWDWDIQNSSLYWSPRLKELLGYADDELKIDFDMFDSMLHPDDEERVGGAIEAHLRDRTTYDVEERLRTKSGEYRWYRARGQAIWDEAGQPLRMTGSTTDITEAKQAETERERLLTALKYRSTQLQTAAEVSRAVTGILDSDELIQKVVDLVQERFDLYYAGLFLVDRGGEWTGEPGKWAVLRAGTGEAGRQMLEAGHKLEIGGTSMIGWCVANAQARIALDVGEEAVRFENPWLPETRSEMALPLVSRGRVIGATTIQSTQEAAFSDEDIAVLQTMADQLAVAIENARLFDEEQQASVLLSERVEQLGCLNDIGRKMEETPSVPEFLEWVAERIPMTMRHPDACVSAVEFEDHVYGTVEAFDLPRQMVQNLRVGGKMMGWISVAYRGEHDFLDEDSTLLGDIARRVSGYIENRRLLLETQRALQEVQQAHQQYLRREWRSFLASRKDEEGIGYVLTGDGLRPMPYVWSPEIQMAVQSQHPVVVTDTEEAPLPSQDGNGRNVSESAIETRSALAAPITLRGQVIGALDIFDPDQPREWTDDDLALVDAVTSQVALAVENARLFEQSQAALAETEALYRASHRITTSIDLPALYQILVDEMAGRLGADQCQLTVFGQETGYSEIVAEYRPTSAEDKTPVLMATNPAYVILRDTQRPLTIGDVSAHPAFAHFKDVLARQNVESMLLVPILVRGELIGSLEIDSVGKERTFTEPELDFCLALANQAAITIDNMRTFEEQKETAERLREMDKLKTQFLANMSHELRTPLNSIIGFSRVILKGIDGPLTAMQQTDLTAIYNSGQHLLGLINDILDLSKIEAGKMELSFDEVDLKPIIKGVMSSAVGLVKGKPIELDQHVPDDLPIIWVDGTRVRQVLLNLVANATKFTEEGKITLSASYDDEWVTICVTDTGIGVPQEKIGSIFEEFTQVDGSTTRSAGGTGLGLPISRHFVEMHGGKITVESRLGVGSVFTVTLPIHAQTEPEAEEIEADQTADESPTVGRRVVLAVDDDRGVISLYQRYLEGEGYQVIGLTSSEDVLDKVIELQPFAITLDVLMPNKDGWQVLRELKECPQTRHIPIIICSIVSNEGLGFSLGAADYLVKPFVEEELLAALARLDQQEDEVEVLVIDDQADDILLIRRILEAQHRYRVFEAGGGQAGIDLVQRRKPNIIILDLMMPEVDGFAVLEALKREPDTRNIPVIVITAKELTEEEEQQLMGHVESLLRKGLFTESELLADLGEALARLESHQTK